LGWALLSWGAGVARGDGKVLPPVLMPQEVAMPDQRAILAWSEGVHRMVIESAFVGAGTDFAWVVPLPAKPEVESATGGTLAAMAALMQPVVIPSEGDLWWLVGAVVVLALLVSMIVGFRRNGRRAGPREGPALV
jgi:hypothetical protein